MKDQLISKLRSKNAIIGIFGLGYVGLPLMIRYAAIGYKVIGFDIDKVKVDNLNAGKSYIKHISSANIELARQHGFEATSDFSFASQVDAIILCLPTPLNRYREPDLSFVTNTIDNLLPFLRKGQIISLESTTYPGTTEEEIKPRIDSVGLRVGTDVFLVYSPEREDPGNESFETSTIPKVIGGFSKTCLEAGIALYEGAIKTLVPVSSTKVAEMTKLLENIHRSVNIGLVNEMKIVADRMGIDIHEVINAAATKPFGFTPFYPGPGLGGHCIPIDPFYLTWKAREFNLHTRFIELAGEINTSMPIWVLNKVVDALNTRSKSLNGAKVLVLGITYKKDVDDMRESPAVELMRLLTEKGAIVEYSDPFIKTFPKMRNYHFSMESTEVSEKTIKKFDLVLIVANHSDFNYKLIKKNAKLIVDTRGVYSDNAENIVKA